MFFLLAMQLTYLPGPNFCTVNLSTAPAMSLSLGYLRSVMIAAEQGWKGDLPYVGSAQLFSYGESQWRRHLAKISLDNIAKERKERSRCIRQREGFCGVRPEQLFLWVDQGGPQEPELPFLSPPSLPTSAPPERCPCQVQTHPLIIKS